MFNIKKVIRLIAVLMCAAIVVSFSAAAFASDMVHPFTITVETDGGDRTEVDGLYASYPGNIYLSMYDLSAALNRSNKHFSFEMKYTERDGEYFALNTNQYFLGRNGFRPEHVWLDVYRNRLFVNGEEKRYYTYRYGNDLYINIGDIELILDVSAEYKEDGSLLMHTNGHLDIDLEELAETGYFDYFTGIVVGDATDIEPLFYRNRFQKTSIASTSKLMTYLLVMEAIDEGKLTLNDMVTISQYAAEISDSEDGTISMKRGQEVPVIELLQALLIASSNESAVALAEHISGSEEEFVKKMNDRAEQLELSTAEFYNPNGLPVYTNVPFSAKLQNRMSAWDMFRLAAYILDKYPQITDITSLEFCRMESLNYTSANSNTLNFNIPAVTGLKTGSTNKAGSCVVTSMPVTYNGVTHNIVSVVFGAETPGDRGQAAEILMIAARNYYQANGFGS